MHGRDTTHPDSPADRTTLVIGLGNPLLSDDRVGLEVAWILRDRLGDDERRCERQVDHGGHPHQRGPHAGDDG